MVKTYSKSISRMLRSNIIRLLSVSLIIAIGISLVTGVSGLPEKMRDAALNTIPVTEDSMMALDVADKVELLGYVFPVFFIAVAGLAALSTITRLVEEERASIACLKTLGYSNAAIIIKYVIFAAICSIVGCVLGVIIGNYAILPILYNSVTLKFGLAESSGTVFITFGITWSVVMSTAVILTAFVVSFLKCKKRSATLLRAKAPKAGRKIVIEYLPFIWKRLKFKYKSTVRNIFRYKGRFIATIVSVIGATMMLFCGIGLFGSLNGMRGEYAANGFVDSIIPIAVAVVVFAIALAVLVLFNLTNINIEERKREIATLRVLGYGRTEVAGYVYREILLISVAGIIIGLPSGYFFLGFIFDYIGFGSLEFIKWYVWLTTAVASFLSVLIADALLYYKIVKVDMTSSLKTVD